MNYFLCVSALKEQPGSGLTQELHKLSLPSQESLIGIDSECDGEYQVLIKFNLV